MKITINKSDTKAQSPEFYAFEPNASEVATVTLDGRTAQIMVCGEMRLIYGDSIIRYADDLVKAGITTDEELDRAINADEIEVANNPWFEVWIDDLESDAHFTVDEAVEQAIEMLRGNL